eukprot:3369868-Pleurochrysis_carterae.AAC.2
MEIDVGGGQWGFSVRGVLYGRWWGCMSIGTRLFTVLAGTVVKLAFGGGGSFLEPQHLCQACLVIRTPLRVTACTSVYLYG